MVFTLYTRGTNRSKHTGTNPHFHPARTSPCSELTTDRWDHHNQFSEEPAGIALQLISRPSSEATPSYQAYGTESERLSERLSRRKWPLEFQRSCIVETTPARFLVDIELRVQDLLNGWQSHCATPRLMHSLGFLPHGDIRVARSWAVRVRLQRVSFLFLVTCRALPENDCLFNLFHDLHQSFSQQPLLSGPHTAFELSVWSFRLLPCRGITTKSPSSDSMPPIRTCHLRQPMHFLPTGFLFEISFAKICENIRSTVGSNTQTPHEAASGWPTYEIKSTMEQWTGPWSWISLRQSVGWSVGFLIFGCFWTYARCRTHDGWSSFPQSHPILETNQCDTQRVSQPFAVWIRSGHVWKPNRRSWPFLHDISPTQTFSMFLLSICATGKWCSSRPIQSSFQLGTLNRQQSPVHAADGLVDKVLP